MPQSRFRGILKCEFRRRPIPECVDELLPTDFWDEPTTSVASRVRGRVPRSVLIQIAGVIILIAVLIVRG